MLCALLVIIACIMFNNNILPIAKFLFMLFMFDYIILSILNILLEVYKLEYFLNLKEHILRGSLWNQSLVNLSFDDNKTRFETNIIFQVWLSKKIFKVVITKTKSSQREINKKKKTSKRTPAFICLPTCSCLKSSNSFLGALNLHLHIL